MAFTRLALRNIRARFLTSSSQRALRSPKKGDKVVVAMSGGVDSSVAALILAQKDYDLSAVYMRNWDTHDEFASEAGCEWEKDWEDVQSVCRHLGLPCELIDFSSQYWTRVFEPTLRNYEDGLTPNPDVSCNQNIKFGLLMEKTIFDHESWLATGHYANISWSEDDRPRLIRAVDRTKDQTYFLASVLESSLRKTLFPLGTLLKSETREMARKAKLATASRSESMGICFVGKRRRFDHFLSGYLPSKHGDIVDLEANVVGRHEGLWRYTIGQGAKIRGMGERMFVASKDPTNNRLLVVPGTDHPALYRSSINAHSWRWIWPDFLPSDELKLTVQIRHRMQEVPCTVTQRTPNEVKITFTQPEKAIAPGQVAVVWDNDWCLGCGIISI